MQAIERVGVSHPECCEANNANGQCEYRRVSGSRNCPVHAGGAAVGGQEKRELTNLRLNSLYGNRAKELSGKGSVKNLTDEIALMRVALETIFNMIESANDMFIHVDKIDKLTSGIMKLIESWQKIQEKNKELLGRETVMAIFDQLIEAIVLRVKDPDVVKALADDGYNIIIKALGKEE